MAETITKEEYDEKVSLLAGCAVGEAEEDHPENPEGNIHGVVSDVLYGDEWFSMSWFGPAAHGCIIEHSDHETDPVSSLLEEKDVAGAIKTMAYYCLEHDVAAEARGRLDDTFTR